MKTNMSKALLCSTHPLTFARGCLAFLLIVAAASPGHASGGGPAQAKPADSLEVSAPSDAGDRNIRIGEFQVRTSISVLSRKDTVSFILHVIVKDAEFKTFERLYHNRKIKVRDQIVIATRMVPIEDYDDPRLEQFRRRILLRLRRSLPELPIEEVQLSDFSLAVEAT